jgi:hypothetical protein
MVLENAEARNDCADEDQQQLNRPTKWRQSSQSQGIKTEGSQSRQNVKYGHGTQNQE